MEIVVKTFGGLEEVCSSEIRSLGGKRVKVLNRGVSFEGELDVIYKCLIGLRTALRILVPIFQFKAHTEKDLYFKARKQPWEDYLRLDQTFSIDCVAFSSVFKHSKFTALRVKDAICDRFRSLNDDQRPSVDKDRADVPINVHVSDLDVVISLDFSGYSLHQRGYRSPGHEAPLNEALAAGLILLTGWKGETDFVDPMCGSGTLLLEAAMIAQNIPPRLNNDDFACLRWDSYDGQLWSKIKKELKANIEPSGVRILGNDISFKYSDMAKASARELGFMQIDVSTGDFRDFNPKLETGIVITNPPYGERMQEDDIIAFYKSIGDTLKQYYTDFDAWVFSSNFQALKFIGLKPSKKIPLKNGPLDCKIHKYEMYRGTKKVKEGTEEKID